MRNLDKYFDIYFGVTPIRCLFLEEIIGLPKDKIRLLPIGSDLEQIQLKVTKDEFKEKNNLGKETFVITTGGKLTSEKNGDRLIEAFKRLSGDNLRLFIFGKIIDEKVKKLIKTDDRIVTSEWLNRHDTLAALKYSDVGIWNTQHTTLMEDAVSVGLPLILRYYGSTCHLINDSGVFLYEGSVREIQDKLNFMVKNNEILTKFRLNSNNHAKMLSYKNIALESILYMKDNTPKNIHSTLMGSDFFDYSYPHLRVLKRSDN